MKKGFNLLVLIIQGYLCFSQLTGSFTDPRDGRVYKTVTIGTQTVMAENLAFKPTAGAYWAYDNDPANAAIYGYLYDWPTAKQTAPPGWHLPSKTEWETLYHYLGKDDTEVYNKVKSGGDSGFNTLLGGFRDKDQTFSDIEKLADFWSSTAGDGNFAWHFFIFPYTEYAFLHSSSSTNGLSVRLFRD